MLRVPDVSLPVDHADDDLRHAVAQLLGIPEADILQLDVVQQSIDARRRAAVRFVYLVDVRPADESRVSADTRTRLRITVPTGEGYHFFVHVPASLPERPVVVGAGPCGLFGALLLARLGLRPLLLERGKPVTERVADVQRFWHEGRLEPESNVLFGEGGAGTFSDGKLNTQVKDTQHRRAWILRELLAAGAPEGIRHHARPHIGTDKLARVVQNIRGAIQALGGEVRFQSRVTGLHVDNKRLRGMQVNGVEFLEASHALLATGHSARDTFQMLYETGIVLSPKAFSIGARIEHPQSVINHAQYGPWAGHPRLGPADYRLAHHCANRRTVYTFCMCPGGTVIAASGEPDVIVANGMSAYARCGPNANSGLLVGVSPQDFPDMHPLAGVAFQRRWEQAAYVLGGGGFRAPAQCVGDLLAGRGSVNFGSVTPTYMPGATPADLRECLPEYVTAAWREALPALGRKLRGFDMPDAVLTGVETRSSSPVRIDRTPEGESIAVAGLFPAGEGAGYAGGIMSAAIDGLRAAETIARRLCAAASSKGTL